MANTKEIQRRIKSISSTKKITKAMEMVAAAKMRRTTEAVLRTRPYANLSWVTVLNLAKAVNSNGTIHLLLSERKDIKKVAIVLFSSNRGLCGGFNSAIMAKARNSIIKHNNLPTDFIVIGKKGLAVNSRYKYNVSAQFEKNDTASEIKEVQALAKMMIDDFLNKKYDKVLVAYTDFVNPAKQVPRVKQILPIDVNAEDDHLGIVGKDEKLGVDKEFVKEKQDKYLSKGEEKFLMTYEPSAEEVLNQMLPRLIEVQLFQALLESNASEHSARMSAMNKATEAASDLVKELTLFYNKARQASITAEIAEISAGANALE
ncbi:MAG: ATP synthase F1 subunit gamma [Candidatus Pacebacteria bacterium]|nr:ATP synthase F1 subunit gamma [Candidatus Paceibacterota bacterium]